MISARSFFGSAADTKSFQNFRLKKATENREKRGIFLENVKKIPNYAGLELTSGIFLDTIRLQQDICRYNFGTMAREFLP